MAIDDSTIFFATGIGPSASLSALPAAGGAPRAVTAAPWAHGDLFFLGEELVWSVDALPQFATSFAIAGKDGLASRTLANVPYVIGAFTLKGDVVYGAGNPYGSTTDPAIFSVTMDGTLTLLATTAKATFTYTAIATDDRDIYWGARDDSTTLGFVGRVPLTGGGPTIVGSPPIEMITSLAVDDSCVYALSQGALFAIRK
jgi:hypothetical protein